MTEPFSIEEAILTGDDCPKYTARDMQQAVAAERERWRAWVEEAVSYVGCATWSPSLKDEGDALLRENGPNA